jgi:hypothetical protein
MRTDCDEIYYQRVEEESELILLSSNKLLENGYDAYFDPLKMVYDYERQVLVIVSKDYRSVGSTLVRNEMLK